MINTKVFGMLLLAGVLAAASIVVATTWSQNASASPLESADLDVAEAQTENATMTNQTSLNATGTNSTN